MSFVNDLKQGEAYEDFILSFIKRYYLPWLEKNKERMGIDLIDLSNWLTVEVKYDRQMSKTWNVFIEYACNGKPSWIFKYSNWTFFIYWCDEFFVITIMKDIQDIVPHLIKEYRNVNGWDWWRSKWVLVPIEYFKSLGRVFKIKYN